MVKCTAAIFLLTVDCCQCLFAITALILDNEENMRNESQFGFYPTSARPFIQDVSQRLNKGNKELFKFIDVNKLIFVNKRLLKEKATKLRVLNITWSKRTLEKS